MAPQTDASLRVRLRGLHPLAPWTAELRLDLDGDLEPWPEHAATAKPGPDGAARFALPAWWSPATRCRLRITASDANYAPLAYCQDELVDIGTELGLDVQVIALLTGRVVDAANQPVPAVRVSAFPLLGDSVGDHVEAATDTDASGNYRLRAPPDVPLLIVAIAMVEAAGTRLASQLEDGLCDNGDPRGDLLPASTRVLAHVATPTPLADLVLLAAANITGTVHWHDGTPVELATVTATPRGGAPLRIDDLCLVHRLADDRLIPAARIDTDQDGTFTLPGVPDRIRATRQEEVRARQPLRQQQEVEQVRHLLGRARQWPRQHPREQRPGQPHAHRRTASSRRSLQPRGASIRHGGSVATSKTWWRASSLLVHPPAGNARARSAMAISPGGTFSFTVVLPDGPWHGHGPWKGVDRDALRAQPRLLGPHPAIAFAGGMAHLTAAGDERTTSSSVRFALDPRLVTMLQPRDHVHVARNACGGLGQSVLREGELVIAIGAVTHVRLGGLAQAVQVALLADAVGVSIRGEKCLLEKGQARQIGGYAIHVESVFEDGEPGTSERVSIALLAASEAAESTIRLWSNGEALQIETW